MIPDYEIAEGDSLPAIEAEQFLDADENPISFTEEDAVILRVQRSGNRDAPMDLECEITQLSPAKAISPPLSDLKAGRYTARFIAVLAEGGQVSYPNGLAPLYIRVNDNMVAEESSS